jgi:hypothetical protein
MTFQILPAPLFQFAVQRFQRINAWNRDQIVAACEVQQMFHMTLLVRSPDQTEVLLEQKVALESQKLRGHLALTIANDLCDSKATRRNGETGGDRRHVESRVDSVAQAISVYWQRNTRGVNP